jgi:catechol 2,3-dioxygenase-like lactoylglutathione lyase family enzyme
MPKLSLKGISYICKDVDATLAFYTKKLDFIVKTDFKGDNFRWVEIKQSQDDYVGLMLFAAKPGEEGLIGKQPGLFLETEDFDATYKEWKERGVEFSSEVIDSQWRKEIFLKDIDGNSVHLGQKKSKVK